MELDLTKCETKIVELKAKGFLAKQICDKLFVSIHTVKQHTKNALKRNNLSNGFELVARYAATHPDLFKKALMIIVLVGQSLLCFDMDDNRLRRVKSKTLTKTIVKRRRKAD